MIRTFAFCSVLFFAAPLVAKLPPTDFVATRLTEARVSHGGVLKMTLFRKSPKDFSKTVTLYDDVGAKFDSYEISKTQNDTGARLLAIALFSQTVFSDVTKFLGPIDHEAHAVTVIDDALCYRYGKNPSVSVDPETGALRALSVSRADGTWRLVVVETKDGLRGSVFRSGVIYVRFTFKRSLAAD